MINSSENWNKNIAHYYNPSDYGQSSPILDILLFTNNTNTSIRI